MGRLLFPRRDLCLFLQATRPDSSGEPWILGLRPGRSSEVRGKCSRPIPLVKRSRKSKTAIRRWRSWCGIHSWMRSAFHSGTCAFWPRGRRTRALQPAISARRITWCRTLPSPVVPRAPPIEFGSDREVGGRSQQFRCCFYCSASLRAVNRKMWITPDRDSRHSKKRYPQGVSFFGTAVMY